MLQLRFQEFLYGRGALGERPASPGIAAKTKGTRTGDTKEMNGMVMLICTSAYTILVIPGAWAMNCVRGKFIDGYGPFLGDMESQILEDFLYTAKRLPASGKDHFRLPESEYGAPVLFFRKIYIFFRWFSSTEGDKAGKNHVVVNEGFKILVSHGRYVVDTLFAGGNFRRYGQEPLREKRIRPKGGPEKIIARRPRALRTRLRLFIFLRRRMIGQQQDIGHSGPAFLGAVTEIKACTGSPVVVVKILHLLENVPAA